MRACRTTKGTHHAFNTAGGSIFRGSAAWLFLCLLVAFCTGEFSATGTMAYHLAAAEGALISNILHGIPILGGRRDVALRLQLSRDLRRQPLRYRSIQEQ